MILVLNLIIFMCYEVRLVNRLVVNLKYILQLDYCLKLNQLLKLLKLSFSFKQLHLEGNKMTRISSRRLSNFEDKVLEHSELNK